MIEEISSLLFQTYSAQGGDANEQIQNAVQRLDGYGGNPQFCECIFQIIQSEQISQGIKNAAIIYIKNMILLHWSEEIPPESKAFITNSLPTLLLSISETSYPHLNKLAASVVSKTFFANEWPNIIPIIFAGFESKDDRHFLISLILLNSVSLLFAQVPNERFDMYAEYSTQFLALLTSFVSESPSLFHVSICFKIACHFSKSQIPPLFQSNPESLKIWILRALKISEPIDDPYYDMFTLSSLRFLSKILYKYEISLFSDDVPVEMLNSVVSCLNSGPSTKILFKCAYFIKIAIHSRYTWPSILADLDGFIKKVILQFFILTPQDMDDAINDPLTFVSNFHSNYVDNPDLRSAIYSAIEIKSHVSPELRAALGSLLHSIIPLRTPEFDQITFSVCLLFSTVSKYIHNPEEVTSFCNMIMPLLQSESFIVRCGALLAIRDMKNIPAPIVLLAFSILTSENEFPLVKYYSALDLSSFLTNIDDQTANLVRSEMNGKNVTDIVTSYFILAQEFNDYDFINLIESYIKFFGPCLIEIAQSFVAETYNTFLNFSRKESQSNIILSSLSQYLEMLEQAGQAEILNETITFLLAQIINTIKSNILVPYAIISVADLVDNIIATSPVITELHWQTLVLFSELVQFSSVNSNFNPNPNEMLMKPSTSFSFSSTNYPFLLEAVCIAYKNLVIKDTETARKPEISNNLISTAVSLIFCQNDLKEAGPAFSFLATLLVILTGCEIPAFSELYDRFVPIVVDGFSVNKIAPSAALLFAAMIIFNSDYLFALLNDKKTDILLNWANLFSKSACSVLLVVLNKKHHAFTNQENVLLISRAVYLVSQTLIENTAFDENNLYIQSYSVNPKELSLFSESQVLMEFGNVLNELNSACPELIQAVQSNVKAPIFQIISSAIDQSCS